MPKTKATSMQVDELSPLEPLLSPSVAEAEGSQTWWEWDLSDLGGHLDLSWRGPEEQKFICHVGHHRVKIMFPVTSFEELGEPLVFRKLEAGFLIGEDGLVYEGRGWDTKGAHTGATWNPISIGISFMGNYMERVPPARAIRAAQNLLTCGVKLGALTRNYEVKGHRDVQQTLSPGDQLYALLQRWPHYRE
ncbi:peptidoglycan recognition protein 1-like [Dugong dugon]